MTVENSDFGNIPNRLRKMADDVERSDDATARAAHLSKLPDQNKKDIPDEER